LFNVLKDEVFANPLEIYAQNFKTYEGTDDGSVFVEGKIDEDEEDDDEDDE